jgi:hypothetical protein
MACSSSGGSPTSPRDGSTDDVAANDGSPGDASTREDAPSDAIASDTPGDATPAMFACGNSICDSATQYCMTVQGGADASAAPQDAGPADGGSGSACRGIPSSCSTTPTCNCLQSLSPCSVGSFECTDSGGELEVRCLLP